MQCSDVVIALHRPGFYNLKNFTIGDDTFDTGLTAVGAGDDDLMIEVVLKNRNGNPGLIAINHNIKYNQFSNLIKKDSYI